MTDGMFCANCLSQYQEIWSKTRLFQNWEIFENGWNTVTGFSLYK